MNVGSVTITVSLAMRYRARRSTGRSIQWSKLKKKAEQFFAPSVAGRVQLRATRYRGAHDQTVRGYITVDGTEVWRLRSNKWW
jgi:hypothetical protein